MICQACCYYDPTGASLINCPNCDGTIGKTPELPASAQTQTQTQSQTAAEPAEETPIMYFFEVKDSTTVNAVIHVVKAQSEPDAKEGLLQHYRQVGITKYTIERISVSSIGAEEEEVRKRPGYSGYLVRKQNGDVEKRPVKR